MTDSAQLFDLGPGPRVDAARVLVDIDLPHLDHLLDYAVPDSLRDVICPGLAVKVPLAGRSYVGWVIERVQIDSLQRVLQPISGVVSTVPVLDKTTYEHAQYIASRHAATTSQVLSLVIPARHAGAEKERSRQEFSWEVDAGSTPEPIIHNPSIKSNEHPTTPVLEKAISAWQMYSHSSAFLSALAQGKTPRAVWTPLPQARNVQLLEALKLNFLQRQQAIVIFPTQVQAVEFHEFLSQHLRDATAALYYSDQPNAQRYGTYLDALSGNIDIVVGTRSAAWIPAPRLGLLFLWDDGDDRLREQRAPRVDALDVCVSRVHTMPCALLVGAWARSVKAQALVASGWADNIVSDRDYRRHHMPRVVVPDVYTMDKEGASAFGQIPTFIQQQIRRALDSGPVLVHVPAGGYVPRIACQQCRALARCTQCQGQLSVTADQTINCLWCARVQNQWHCPNCHSTQLRALNIGSARTGENLGKAFPGVPLVHSRAGHLVNETLDRRPRLVVATPGAEPSVEGGYELAVVLDPDAISQRPELWAPEEALRRWMNVFSLVSQHGQGIVAGVIEPLLAQSLIRWDPTYLSEHLLRERIELGFFPATTIVALEGPSSDVRAVTLSLNKEVLATMPLKNAQTEYAGERVRTLLRIAKADTAQALAELRKIQQSRSAHKEPLVKVSVNPPELFQ